MYFQHEYEREAVSMTLGATYQLDLPQQGLLSSLAIRLSGAEVSAYGQAGGNWRIIDEISKLEIIIDGAVVAKSLTGLQVQALSVFDQGLMPPSSWRNYATNVQYCYMLLNFGRWMYDTELGLDLSRHKNVEIRLTNTGGSSSFTDLTATIQKVLLRDAAAGQFKGYMRTEEWRRWTTVSDQTVYLILPSEYDLRRIMLQAIPPVDSNYLSECGINSEMDDIDLTFLSGQERVYKGGIDDLIRLNHWMNGKPLISSGVHYMSADKGVNVGLGYVNGGAWGAGSLDGSGASTVATMEASRTDNTQKPESYEADSPMDFVFTGMAPHNCALLSFDTTYQPVDWIDPVKKGTINLNIHTRSGASYDNGTNAVVLDRLVRY